MLDFSRKKENGDCLQLHHATCKAGRDCLTCALYEAMFKRPQNSNVTYMESHPASFLVKIYTLIVYATKNLQYPTLDDPLVHTERVAIRTRWHMDTINERFFFGLWTAIASIVPTNKAVYEEGA